MILESTSLKIINTDPLCLDKNFLLDINFILQSVNRVNKKFQTLMSKTNDMELNIFEVLDFRTISGLIGETLVDDMSKNHSMLEKNPNIDGYPDLLNISESNYQTEVDEWKTNDLSKFIKYPHGGIEVKNTFGTKKQNVDLTSNQTRIKKINKKLEWKAHHNYTNNLLALFSDYIDNCPQIAAVMFSDKLTIHDWNEKQNPTKNSTMTSFTVTKSSGYEKLISEIKLCVDKKEYLSFFDLET